MNAGQRQAVVAAAERWLRTPWQHNAKVLGAGVDCGQLIIAAYAEAGLIEDVETGSYAADFMLHRNEERFLEWVEKYLDRVDAPLPGDVAVWRIGKCFSHGAIVTAWPKIIHAYRRERMVVYGDGVRSDLGHRVVRFYSMAGRLP